MMKLNKTTLTTFAIALTASALMIYLNAHYDPVNKLLEG